MSDTDDDNSLHDSLSDDSSVDSESDSENEAINMEWVNCQAREREVDVCLHQQPKFVNIKNDFLVLIFFFMVVRNSSG